MRKPPINGPSTLERPKVAPKKPLSLPRSRGEYRSATMAKADVNSDAEPRPCTARERISCVALTASPHSSEPSRKMTMPASSTFRRPMVSESLPRIGTSTPASARIFCELGICIGSGGVDICGASYQSPLAQEVSSVDLFDTPMSLEPMLIRAAVDADAPAIWCIIEPMIRGGESEHARARGYRAMQFNFVIASNDRAVRLSEHLGFATVGRMSEGFLHPRRGFVDALIVSRRLDEVRPAVGAFCLAMRRE